MDGAAVVPAHHPAIGVSVPEHGVLARTRRGVAGAGKGVRALQVDAVAIGKIGDDIGLACRESTAVRREEEKVIGVCTTGENISPSASKQPIMLRAAIERIDAFTAVERVGTAAAYEGVAAAEPTESVVGGVAFQVVVVS